MMEKVGKPENGKMRVALALGVLGSVISAGCCAIPVILLSFGLGGAWASRFAFLDRIQPFLVFISLVSLGWGVRLFVQRLRGPACRSDIGFLRTGVFWIIVIGSLFILVFPWISSHYFHLRLMDRDSD
ncbi:MAG: probable mercuric transport protein (MerT) [Leptospirillum rubarum]|jgi:mercuric ion transport protein|nr:MAG: probable mercuric transport protein (MerT) [Leptospirillum rubarum]